MASSSSAEVEVVEVVEMGSSQPSSSTQDTFVVPNTFGMNFLLMDEPVPFKRTSSQSTKSAAVHQKGKRQTVAKYHKHFRSRSARGSGNVKKEQEEEVQTSVSTECDVKSDLNDSETLTSALSAEQFDDSMSNAAGDSTDTIDTEQSVSVKTESVDSVESGISQSQTVDTPLPCSQSQGDVHNAANDAALVLSRDVPMDAVIANDVVKQEPFELDFDSCSDKEDNLVNITSILEQFLNNIESGDVPSEVEQTLFAPSAAYNIIKNTSQEIECDAATSETSVSAQDIQPPLATASPRHDKNKPVPKPKGRTKPLSAKPSDLRVQAKYETKLTKKCKISADTSDGGSSSSTISNSSRSCRLSETLKAMMECQVRLQPVGRVVKDGSVCWKRRGSRIWRMVGKIPKSPVAASVVLGSVSDKKSVDSSSADSVPSTSKAPTASASPISSASDRKRVDSSSADSASSTSKASTPISSPPPPGAAKLDTPRAKAASKRVHSMESSSSSSHPTDSEKAASKCDIITDDKSPVKSKSPLPDSDKSDVKGESSLTDFERAIANFDSDAGPKAKKPKFKIRRLSAPGQKESVSEKASSSVAVLKSAEPNTSQQTVQDPSLAKRVQQSRLLQSILNKQNKGGVLPRIPKLSHPPEAPKPFEEILKSPLAEPTTPFLAEDAHANAAQPASSSVRTNAAGPVELRAEPNTERGKAEGSKAGEDQLSPSEAWDFDREYQFEGGLGDDDDYQSPAQTWEPKGQSSKEISLHQGGFSEMFISNQGGEELASAQVTDMADGHNEEYGSFDNIEVENQKGISTVSSTSVNMTPVKREFENFSGFRESDRVDILSLCGDGNQISVDGFEADSSTNQTDFWPHQHMKDRQDGRPKERLMTENQLLRMPNQPWQVMMREWNAGQDDVLSLCNSDSFLDDEEHNSQDDDEVDSEKKGDVTQSGSLGDMLESVPGEDEDMPDSHQAPDTQETVDMPDSQVSEEMPHTVLVTEESNGEVKEDKAAPSTSMDNEAEVKITDPEGTEVKDAERKVEIRDAEVKGRVVKSTVAAARSGPRDEQPQQPSSSSGGSPTPIVHRSEGAEMSKNWKRRKMVETTAKLHHCIKTHDVAKAGETVQFIMEHNLGQIDRQLLWSLMDMYIRAGALPQLFSIFFDVCQQGLLNTEVCNAYIRLVCSTCMDMRLVVIQKMLRRIFQTFSTKRIRPAGDCLLFLLNAFSATKLSIIFKWQLLRYCNIIPGFSVPAPLVEVALKLFMETPVKKLRLHVNKWMQGAPRDMLRSLDPAIMNSSRLHSVLWVDTINHLRKVLIEEDEMTERSATDVDEDVELVRDMKREEYFLHRIQDCRRTWNLEYLAKIYVELCRSPHGNRVFQRLYADILLQHDVVPSVRTFLQLVEEEYQRECMKDGHLQLDQVSLACIGAHTVERFFDRNCIDTTVDLLQVLVDSPIVTRCHLVNKGDVGRKVLAACVQAKEPKLALHFIEDVIFTQDPGMMGMLLQQLLQQLVARQMIKGAFKVLKILFEKNLIDAKEMAGLTTEMAWHALSVGDITTALHVQHLHEKVLSHQHPLPDSLLRALLTAAAHSGYTAVQQDLFTMLKKRGVYSVIPFADPPYIIQLNSMFTPAEIKMLVQERLKELYSKLCDDAANGRALSEMDVTVAVDIFFEYDVQMMSMPFLALGSCSKVLAVRALGKILEQHMVPPLSARYDIRSGLVIIEPVSFISFLREMDNECRQLGLVADDDLEEKEPAPSHSSQVSLWKKHKTAHHISSKSHRHSSSQSRRHTRSSSPRRPAHVSSSHQLSEREGYPGTPRDARSLQGKRRVSFHRERHVQSSVDVHHPCSASHTDFRRDRDQNPSLAAQRGVTMGHGSPQLTSHSPSPADAHFSDHLHAERERGEPPQRLQQPQEDFGCRPFRFGQHSPRGQWPHQPPAEDRDFSSQRNQFGEHLQLQFSGRNHSDVPHGDARDSDFSQPYHSDEISQSSVGVHHHSHFPSEREQDLITSQEFPEQEMFPGHTDQDKHMKPPPLPPHFIKHSLSTEPRPSQFSQRGRGRFPPHTYQPHSQEAEHYSPQRFGPRSHSVPDVFESPVPPRKAHAGGREPPPRGMPQPHHEGLLGHRPPQFSQSQSPKDVHKAAFHSESLGGRGTGRERGRDLLHVPPRKEPEFREHSRSPSKAQYPSSAPEHAGRGGRGKESGKVRCRGLLRAPPGEEPRFREHSHSPSQAQHSPSAPEHAGRGQRPPPSQDIPPGRRMPPPSIPIRHSTPARPPLQPSPMRQMPGPVPGPERSEQHPSHPSPHQQPHSHRPMKRPLLPDPPDETDIASEAHEVEDVPDRPPPAPRPPPPRPHHQGHPRPPIPQNVRGMRPGPPGHPQAPPLPQSSPLRQHAQPEHPAPPRGRHPSLPHAQPPRHSAPPQGRPPRPWRGHAAPRPQPGFREAHEYSQDSAHDQWEQEQTEYEEHWEHTEEDFKQQEWVHECEHKFPPLRGRGQGHAFRVQKGHRPPTFAETPVQRCMVYRGDHEEDRTDFNSDWAHEVREHHEEIVHPHGQGLPHRLPRGWRGGPPVRGRGGFRGH